MLCGFIAISKSELLSEQDIKQFDELCGELNIAGIKINQAQLQLTDIEKPIVTKTKPFYLMQEGLKFHTHVFQLDHVDYDIDGLFDDLVQLNLIRVKGLIVSHDKTISINISEHEAKIENVKQLAEQTVQGSVIECIDIAPINETAINKIVQENRMNG